jgi:hypothetical protein
MQCEYNNKMKAVKHVPTKWSLLSLRSVSQFIVNRVSFFGENLYLRMELSSYPSAEHTNKQEKMKNKTKAKYEDMIYTHAYRHAL